MLASEAIGTKPDNSAKSYAAYRSAIHLIPTIDGCATPVTPTIISLASSDRRPKPRRVKSQRVVYELSVSDGSRINLS